ncbi:MAG: hypothetical protein M1279_02565 [Candidatus Marsarchaeota archaeon]|nr:hypothetical protein [Candidatus Marsarchaeota archaeon]
MPDDTNPTQEPSEGMSVQASRPADTGNKATGKYFGYVGKAIKDKLKERYVFSFVIYLAIALIIFAPITANMSHMAPGSGGDMFQNLWDIWWVDYATFTLHTSIWYTNLLYPPLGYPQGVSLAYQTMSPIGSLLSLPFQLVNIIFAYNSILFISFAVSGLTMFILAEYLTKNKHAAFIAGMIFSFSAFHIAEAFAHIDWMFVAWVPLALYFFLRMLNGENNLLNPIGLGIALVLVTFMGDIEQLLMTTFMFIIIILAYLVYYAYAAYRGTHQRNPVIGIPFWRSIIIAVVVTLVIGSFGFIPIISTLTSHSASIKSTVNQYNSPINNEAYSDNLLSFFLPSFYNGFFNGAATSYFGIYYTNGYADPTEKISYIGYVAILLALYGIYRLGIRKTGLWILIAVVFGWMSLGPYVQIGYSPFSQAPSVMSSTITSIPGIYSLYHDVPLFNVVREPGRFDLIFEMSAAIMAAFGFSELAARRFKTAKSTTAAAAIVCIIFFIGSSGIVYGNAVPYVTTPVHIPRVYSEIAADNANFTVLILPALSDQNAMDPATFMGEDTFYTAIMHKPIIGGDLTRPNQTETLYMLNLPIAVQAQSLELGAGLYYTSPVAENYTNETLLTLYNYNDGLMLVNGAGFNSTQLKEMLSYSSSVFGPAIADNNTYVFSTSNAISNSVYRSFVAYPLLQYWGTTSKLVNGASQTFWVPLGGGPIEVYSPYTNTTGIANKISSGAVQAVNTTISFEAMSSPVPITMEVGRITSSGSVQQVALLNLSSSRLLGYTVNTITESGPASPTAFVFMSNTPGYNSTSILIRNITFSTK